MFPIQALSDPDGYRCDFKTVQEQEAYSFDKLITWKEFHGRYIQWGQRSASHASTLPPSASPDSSDGTFKVYSSRISINKQRARSVRMTTSGQFFNEIAYNPVTCAAAGWRSPSSAPARALARSRPSRPCSSSHQQLRRAAAAEPVPDDDVYKGLTSGVYDCASDSECAEILTDRCSSEDTRSI